MTCFGQQSTKEIVPPALTFRGAGTFPLISHRIYHHERNITMLNSHAVSNFSLAVLVFLKCSTLCGLNNRNSFPQNMKAENSDFHSAGLVYSELSFWLANFFCILPLLMAKSVQTHTQCPSHMSTSHVLDLFHTNVFFLTSFFHFFFPANLVIF